MRNVKPRTVLPAPEEGLEPPTRRLTGVSGPEWASGAPSPAIVTVLHPTTPNARRGVTPAITRAASRDGVRWVVFQTTSRGRFRLTQWLYAADKQAAEEAAAVLYAGCAGTLAVQSFAEYQAVLDDLDAVRRTRVRPAEPGQRRPNMKRGISYGCCVWCGAVTQSRGGKPPKYCAAHRDRKHQRAYRTGQVVGVIGRPVLVVAAPRRQVVGA